MALAQALVFLISLIPVITVLLISLNFLFAPHNPYQEKYSIFECGYHGFLALTRLQVTVVFIMFAYAYLIFDLELVSLYPFALSAYENGALGLVGYCLVAGILTMGFVYELGKGALTIDSLQIFNLQQKANILGRKYFSTTSRLNNKDDPNRPSRPM